MKFDLISLLSNLSAWIAIGVIASVIYKKQSVQPKKWKAAIVLLVGLFSFSFDFNLKDTLISIPVLPLGAWILYAIYRRKEGRWQMYRSYAWLGFFANLLFLAATLLSIPFHHLVYPQDEPGTYLSDVDDASIIPIHPSAVDHALDQGSLADQIHTLKQNEILSEKWYGEAWDAKNERFPYQLIGARPEWGSGLHAVIYMEDDGKGILVTTRKKQLYFRSEVSLLKEEKD